MIDLVYQHKEWVFSGVGVVLVGVLLRWLRQSGMFVRRVLVRNSRSVWDAATALPGRWTGTTVEGPLDDHAPTTYRVDWNFVVDGATVKAVSTAKYTLDAREQEDTYHLVGKVVNGRFVQLDYRIENAAELTFGTEILEVKPSGIEFEGWFVGFSSQAKRVISGRIVGHKQRDSNDA